MEELSGGSLSGNDTLQQLSELSRLMSATAEGDNLGSILELVAHLFKAEGSILWMLSPGRSQLERARVFHSERLRSKAFEQESGESQLKFGQNLAGLCWAEGKTKILELPGMFAQAAHEGEGSRQTVCSIAFPLTAGGTAVGVMEVINCTNESACAGEQQALISTLSALIGSYLLVTSPMHRGSTGSDSALLAKLKAMEEDVRELKVRLSKEHDQSVQNARYHAGFLSGISRDIRTQLSGITSIVDLLLRMELSSELQEYVMIIKESANAVLQILEDLVEYSRHESEQIFMHPGESGAASASETADTSATQPASSETPALPPANLEKVHVLVVNGLLGTAEFIEAYAKAAGIRCSSASRGQSAVTAMKQALLIDRPYDVVFVERLLPDMDAFDFARVIQQDPMLSDAKLVLVSTFDSTARDDHALRSGFVEHIAKPTKQQQVINTLSAVLQGVPQTIANQSEAPQAEQSPAVARGQRMVLVAEDNPVNQKVALLQLRELGFFATVVSNGREAVDVVKQAHFDAILMDCQMPELDGFEATKQIREWEKTTGRHIPIIAMTANAMSSDKEKCLAVGMNDYLSKPVTYDKLDSVLFKWVESDEAKNLAGVPAMHQPNKEIQGTETQPGGEPVDIAGLSELLGTEEAGDVLMLFVNSTEDLIGQIHDASERKDGKLLREAAHQLKGASSSVGAMSIARACQELEACAKQEQWDAVPKIHHGLIENFETAKRYISTKFS